jgi:hypothetical protein
MQLYWTKASRIEMACGLEFGSKQPVDARLLIDSGVLFLYFFIIIFIGLYMGRRKITSRILPSAVAPHSVVGSVSPPSSRPKPVPALFRHTRRSFALRNFTYFQLARHDPRAHSR